MNFGLRPREASSARVCFEQVDPHAVRVALDLDHVGFVGAEGRDRTRVGRRVADQDVARVDQDLGDQVDRLLPAGGHRHVHRVDPHALGGHHFDDLFADQLEPLGRAVLEDLGDRVAGDPVHLGGEGLGREGGGVGQPAGEGDHVGPGGDRHHVAHRRRPHHPGPFGEQRGVPLQVFRPGLGTAGRWRRGHRSILPVSALSKQSASRPESAFQSA